MSIKFVLLIVVLGFCAIEQSVGHRDHDDRRGRPRGPFTFNLIRNANCTALSTETPSEPPCTSCICFPDNVLNCLSLRPRLCNSNSTTTTTEAAAGGEDVA